MPLDITPISQIGQATEPCKIKVRIARVWGFPNKTKPEEFTGLDLLLVDDKGDRIQASIKGKILSKFQKELNEGDCCVLMNFDICPNLGKFRSCHHPYKINFIFYTCVKPCEQIPNFESRFNFCPFPEIIARRNDDTVFVDIIGEIIGMNEIKSITTTEGPTKLLNLQLKDLGDTFLGVTLWGKLADDVYSEVKNQPSGPVILLGSLMKTLLYQGKGTVQSSKFSTKILINTPLPEIIQFQEALCKEEPTSITTIEYPNSVQVSKHSFSLAERKTISELMEINQVISCNILASLSIDPKRSWFYIGCTTCKTKATHYFNPETEEIEADKYSCEKCGKLITTTHPRFKLHIKATDNTGLYRIL